MNKNITPELLEIINKTVSACGVSLYDAEFTGKILKVFICSSEKISVETCAKVSQMLSQELDMQNIIPSRYLLEVSSPGLERKLRNLNDFRDSIGQTVTIKTRNGRFIGKIISVSNDGILLNNLAGSCAKAGSEQLIPVDSIIFARILISNGELFNEAKKIHALTKK